MTHTEKPDAPCGGSYVALRDFFTLWLERLEVFYDRRFQDLDAKTTLALAAADKAVNKAEVAMEKRFEGVNEFRQTLSDQASKFVTRDEHEGKHQNLQKDIDTIAKEVQAKRDRDLEVSQNKSQYKQGWMVPMIVVSLVAGVNLLINVVNMVLHVK